MPRRAPKRGGMDDGKATSTVAISKGGILASFMRRDTGYKTSSSHSKPTADRGAGWSSFSGRSYPRSTSEQIYLAESVKSLQATVGRMEAKGFVDIAPA